MSARFLRPELQAAAHKGVCTFQAFAESEKLRRELKTHKTSETRVALRGGVFSVLPSQLLYASRLRHSAFKTPAHQLYGPLAGTALT